MAEFREIREYVVVALGVKESTDYLVFSSEKWGRGGSKGDK